MKSLIISIIVLTVPLLSGCLLNAECDPPRKEPVPSGTWVIETETPEEPQQFATGSGTDAVIEVDRQAETVTITYTDDAGETVVERYAISASRYTSDG